MEKTALVAQKRTIVGKKSKQLRRKGIVPANIYGPQVQSLAVQVQEGDFKKVFAKAGGTGIVDLHLEGENIRPVLIKDVQRDPVLPSPVHVDFYQVNLKEKITTAVPLTFVGESEIVKHGEGIFLSLIDEIEVECLPEDIPSEIAVDISSLQAVDESRFVKDLNIPANVTVKTPAEELVCKIEKPRMEEVVEEVKPAEEAAAAEGEEAPSTEKAGKEEEKPAEEGKKGKE